MPDSTSTYQRIVGYLIVLASIGMGLFHVYTGLFGALTAIWQRCIHLGFGFVILYLMESSKSKGWPGKGISAVLALVGVGTAAYLIANFDAIIWRFGSPTTADLIMAAICLALVIDISRRSLGWALPIIAIAFLAYAFVGPYLPGILRHRGYDLARVLNQMYLTTEGIYGVPLGVSASYIFLFILFGSFLLSTGAGDFYISLADAAVGKARGGPAKVAVVASALFGTISGSAQANVAGTGTITIPLMKKTGYKPEFAAAVEATASTGGQIMPPVMGAAAFLMAELLGVPYSRIVMAAIIPAVIYFASVLCSVHFEAVKHNIGGLADEDVPNAGELLRTGWPFIVPLMVLILLLVVFKWTTNKAAVYSVATVILVGFIQKQKPFGIKEIIDSFVDAAKGSLGILASCACAGIVVGVINLTGLGLRFSNIFVTAAGGNLALLLVFTMIACVILGMGLPTTPAYLVLSVLGVPALVTLGVPPLAAHMFIFYYGCLSMITPPVALAVYVGAGLAGANFWKTGWLSVKLGLAAFIVPFFFIYNPSMLWEGSFWSVAYTGLTAVGGAVLLAGAVIGWFIGNLGTLERLILFLSALGLIDPGSLTNVLGLVGMGIVVAIQMTRARNAKKEVASRS